MFFRIAVKAMRVNAEALAWEKRCLAGAVLPSNAEPIELVVITLGLPVAGPAMERQWVMEPSATVVVGSASWAYLAVAMQSRVRGRPHHTAEA